MAQHGPRTVSRHFAFVAICIAMAARLSFSQVAAGQTAPKSGDASSSLAAYDVVSVKPVQASEKMVMMGGQPVRVGFTPVQDLPDGINGDFVTLATLVQSAYAVWEQDSITGLPDWAKPDHFSVQAKMGPEQMAEFSKLSKDEQQQRRQAMLQALLADRFKLQAHRETRQVLGYELVVAKGGPRMKEGAADNSDGPKGPDGKQFRAFLRQGMSKSGAEEVTGQACSMEQLSSFLRHAPGVDRRVVDKTGLTGKYDFTITFAASPGVGPAGDASQLDVSAPSIFTALQEQLGLKLQPGTGTIDVVVVEHVERPAAD
jgi:uncharacterized protein (TIGR03435 family)